MLSVINTSSGTELLHIRVDSYYSRAVLFSVPLHGTEETGQSKPAFAFPCPVLFSEPKFFYEGRATDKFVDEAWRATALDKALAPH